MEQHLSSEALARLIDETPTEDERTHLNDCERCADALDGLRDQTTALGRLPDLRPPQGDWAVLQARLASEGLLRVEPGIFGALARTPGWMKVMAIALLFLGGVGVGIGITGSAFPGAAGASATPPSAGTGPVHSVGVEPAATVEEAIRQLQLAERVYVDALLQLRQLTADDVDTRANPERRLAALEYAILALQAGVENAPGDPALNGLLASAMAERQATLQQVSSGIEWF